MNVLARCLRSLTHLASLVLAGLLAAGSAAASTSPGTDQSSKPPRAGVEELDALRADLLDQLARRNDHSGWLAQWPNWPNWRNGNNWPNWPNWGNFWRNW